MKYDDFFVNKFRSVHVKSFFSPLQNLYFFQGKAFFIIFGFCKTNILPLSSSSLDDNSTTSFSSTFFWLLVDLTGRFSSCFLFSTFFVLLADTGVQIWKILYHTNNQLALNLPYILRCFFFVNLRDI